MKTLSKLGLTLTMVLILTVFVGSAGLAKEMNDEEYNQYLLKALKDKNLGIRSSAAQLLGERKVEAAVKPLTKMLKTEEHYAVRIVAAVALYQIGTDEVLSIFKERIKRDRNKTVRHVLAGLITSIENPKYAKK